MASRWQSLIIRVLLATILAWIVGSVPLPRITQEFWFANVQIPLVVFAFICYIGKLLVDTFFYDRYP